MNVKVETLLAALKLDATRKVLQLVTAGDTARQTAIRAELLAWLLKCSPCATQKEVAARLGISPARFCQMLGTFNRAYRNSR